MTQAKSLPRVANDFYPTPRLLTRALLRKEAIGGHILEPCAGEGDISAQLASNGMKVTTNDLTWPDGWDAADPCAWAGVSTDWTITNPPFSQATPILQNAYKHSRKGVAFLLRLTYLEPCADRAEWLQSHPPSRLIIFNPRPRFRADTKGQDSVTVAWFVWKKNDFYPTTKIDFCTDWKEQQ